MSEDLKSLINLVPDSVDNAVKNITDKPTQYVGITFADIWYLVFGGISQTAEKRKLKYSYALQEFENELKEKISKIPKNQLVEPDIQVIAQAMDAARYCIDKKELRKMYADLISSSMNANTNSYVHPCFANIIRHLSTQDAKVLQRIYHSPVASLSKPVSDNENLISYAILESQGLISIKNRNDTYITLDQAIQSVKLTELGKLFCKICIPND